ncbi:MAG: NAD(P)H-hydrate dehydratase [Prevotellaceae bacterium]|jgi:NAD(P)H-hydrate epimerase|nr:NAD(P)H-hydrate dehydratase [Prevotellaceae bacterium]
MKILIKEQIKEADRYTIENEPIASVDLMERAAEAIAGWIDENVDKQSPLLFVTGKGNNGGDGLAVARILNQKGFDCSIYAAYGKDFQNEECRINMERLPAEIPFINSFKEIDERTIIIDALLGTGISGNVKEPAASIISQINSRNNKVISIDLPSGMSADTPVSLHSNNETNTSQIIKADITLTLEFPKLAMLLPETGEYAGVIITLPVGLNKTYIEQAKSPYRYIDKTLIESLRKKRLKFDYKNIYGHALLICGSKNMIGAAMLATGAALRSGCGLVSVHIPYDERIAFQTRFPSAILSFDKAGYFSELPSDIDKYNAIGTGCGSGIRLETMKAFETLLKSAQIPLVIDADALNMMAMNKELLKYIPANSILTPHPGELKRLTGEWNSEENKHRKVISLSSATKSIIVVKGAHTAIYLPDGTVYFNSTGNAGMAKGGSGDVLTGLITGLLSRGYSSFEAAVTGVYFHGLAGDRACEKYGSESMNSLDLLEEIRVMT